MACAIGIIDSGIGGLSIFSEIKKQLPYEDIIYLADQKNFPYGSKSKQKLNNEVLKLVKFLVIKKNVKLIVIACNTATVHTIDSIRKMTSVPIVGIVPVVKKASEVSKNGKIGVIATKATIYSSYQKALIRKFCANSNVKSIAIDDAVTLIEDLQFEKIIPVLEIALTKLRKFKIDTLALGCTHYNFIKPQIKKVLGGKVEVLDASGAVVRQVKRILIDNASLAQKQKPTFAFHTTGEPNKLQRQLMFLLNLKSDVKKF